MMKRLVCLLSLVVGVLSVLYVPTVTASDIVYSTFGPGQSYNIASGWPVGTLSVIFDETRMMEAAVSFTPSRNYAFDSIDFAASLHSNSSSNQFSVSLARDSGANLPGAALETFSFTGMVDRPAVYSVLSLLHPQLTAGEKYWLIMSADDLLDIYLTWLDADPYLDGEIAYKNGLYADWACEYGSSPSFEVHGMTAVAEPCSMFLLGLGLVMLAEVRRKARG